MSAPNGFTLIEMLVVISIVGLTASVVVPNFFPVIEKVKREVEVKQVVSIVRQVSNKAFIENKFHELRFEGNKVWLDGTELESFQNLEFGRQTIAMLPSGYYQADPLTYRAGGREDKILFPEF